MIKNDKKIIEISKYEKLLFNKVSMLVAHPYVSERIYLNKIGYPNMPQLYIDGEEYYPKSELDKYDFTYRKNVEMIKKVADLSEKLVSKSLSIAYHKEQELKKISKKVNIFLKSWNCLIQVADMPIWCARNYENNFYLKIKKKGFSEKDFSILTTYNQKSFCQKKSDDLVSVKNNAMTVDEFIKKWEWSEMNIFYYHKLTPEKVRKYISELRINENKKNDYKKVYDKLDAKMKKEADLIQEFIKIRDYRFECILKAAYNIYPILKFLAGEMKISYQELINLTSDEIIHKKIPVDLKERLSGFALIGEKIYVGKKLKELKKLIICKGEKILSGRGVSRGKIIAVAKIILDKNDFKKIKKGDILVTKMTTPYFTPILHKTSAILTEIGGFTCHAAIISRELGIPCIIGISNATNIIKDGDKIEVDADEGVVKIIKKKK